jgi:hypothetical protein
MIKYIFLMLILISCSSRKAPPSVEPEASGEAKWQPEIEKLPEIESQDLDPTVPAIVEGVPSEPVKRVPPKIGIVIEGAGLESFLALGFMQELSKEGVLPQKILGTGWGCWLALSWALESSSNQAEWQSFKWSTWRFLGIENSFLSRITGSKASYAEFEKEMKVWLPKSEFNAYALDVDCPMLKMDRNPLELQSSRQLGVYRALWNQLHIPLYNLHASNPKADTLSGLAATGFSLEEYDNFALIYKNSGSVEKVDLWIHLQSSAPSIVAGDHVWLSAAFRRAEVFKETGFRTAQDRWVVKLPLYQNLSLDKKRALDFAERRFFLLKGRELGRAWIEGTWYQNNLAPVFSSAQN